MSSVLSYFDKLIYPMKSQKCSLHFKSNIVFNMRKLLLILGLSFSRRNLRKVFVFPLTSKCKETAQSCRCYCVIWPLDVTQMCSPLNVFVLLFSRMALMKVLNSRPETPYSQPAPLHVRILKVCDQLRVVSWEFRDGTAKPLTTQSNKVAPSQMGRLWTRSPSSKNSPQQSSRGRPL